MYIVHISVSFVEIIKTNNF